MASFKIAIIGAGSIGFTKKLFTDILAVPELTDVCAIYLLPRGEASLPTATRIASVARDDLPPVPPLRRQHVVLGPEARVRDYCKDLDEMLKQHLAGKKTHEKPLWTLLNLEIWHRSCASG